MERAFISDVFTCPKCGGHGLYQINMGCTEWAPIISIQAGDFEYGNWSDGYVCGSEVRYECSGCDFTLTNQDGENLTTTEEVETWLKEHQEDKQ